MGLNGHIGHSVILKAELLAILNGLKLAWERGFKVLYCYTDLMHALSLIKEQQGEFHRHATIIQDIRDLLAFPWKVEMHHTLREGNQCADFFAKLGASDTAKLRIFLSPPTRFGYLVSWGRSWGVLPQGFLPLRTCSLISSFCSFFYSFLLFSFCFRVICILYQKKGLQLVKVIIWAFEEKKLGH